MIYGSIDLEKHGTRFSPGNFESIMGWEGCISRPLKWEGFSGALLLHENIPAAGADFFHVDQDNRIMVLMDGYVFNQSSLSAKLSGHRQTNTPPALICQAFMKWGPSFVEYLNGDFAICIYQKKTNQVFFFRDHLGIRPLAFSCNGSGVVFSTDPMGLCKAMSDKERISPDYLLNQFLWGGYDHTLLPNEKVSEIKPGHFISVEAGKCHQSQYWFPENIKTDKTLTFQKVTKDLKALLSDAVRLRSDKRFMASSHVSGALDSGVVAAMARKVYSEQDMFYGFSWTPVKLKDIEHIAYDERILVRKICALNNMAPVFADYGVEDCLSLNADWRSANIYHAEEKIREFALSRGVNLIFSGWGGDEFISNGNRGIDIDLVRNFEWRSFLKKYPLNKPKRFISAVIFKLLFPGMRKKYLKHKAEPHVYQYIKKQLDGNIIPRKQRFHFRSLRQVYLQLLNKRHLDRRTVEWYVSGQRKGIEYRYPLLDKRIVEYMLKVPAPCLVDGNNHRIIFRAIGKDILPPEVVNNRSKEDPVGNYYQDVLYKETKAGLINAIPVYRDNPELSFVDFELLEKNLPLMNGGEGENNKKSDPAILYYLKSAHRITKGYYEQVS